MDAQELQKISNQVLKTLNERWQALEPFEVTCNPQEMKRLREQDDLLMGFLSDPDLPVEAKAARLKDHCNFYRECGRRWGRGTAGGEKIRRNRLDKTLRTQTLAVQRQIRSSIKAIRQFQLKPAVEKAIFLRGLPTGTQVEIEIKGKRQTVKFVRLNRSRFLAYFANGKRYSVPIACFVGLILPTTGGER